ncbi:MAG: DedA family protein [Egibacteraceae bacterium]
MEWVTDLIRASGAYGLALAMLLENLFPPIPSEVVLPFAGFLVGRGDLGLVPALLGSTAGSTAGAITLYALGRWGGRSALLRFHHVLRMTEEDLDRADDWFDRHGSKVVFFGRMVPGVRSLVSVPAGTSEMPIPRFLVLTAVGSGLWNGLLIGLGRAFGDNYEQLASTLGTGSDVVVVLVGAGVAVTVWWLRRRHARPGARSG